MFCTRTSLCARADDAKLVYVAIIVSNMRLSLGQFRYIKINSKTIDLNVRL